MGAHVLNKIFGRRNNYTHKRVVPYLVLRITSSLSPFLNILFNWWIERDLNSRPLVLQTNTLPTELSIHIHFKTLIYIQSIFVWLSSLFWFAVCVLWIIILYQDANFYPIKSWSLSSGWCAVCVFMLGFVCTNRNYRDFNQLPWT